MVDAGKFLLEELSRECTKRVGMPQAMPEVWSEGGCCQK